MDWKDEIIKEIELHLNLDERQEELLSKAFDLVAEVGGDILEQVKTAVRKRHEGDAA